MKNSSINAIAKRFLLIDDDPAFCAVLEHSAKEQGIELHFYTSLLEFGNMRKPIGYDVVILDYDLGEITGLDAAGYVSGVFGNIPVVLISASSEREILPIVQPGAIRQFVQKSKGCNGIIDVAKSLCTGNGQPVFDYNPRRMPCESSDPVWEY
jgi:CheY-like chemotaxis protein